MSFPVQSNTNPMKSSHSSNKAIHSTPEPLDGELGEKKKKKKLLQHEKAVAEVWEARR